MSANDWFGVALVAFLGGSVAYILIRHPDFRRAFVAHWKPAAVAERINTWAERNRK